MKCFGMSCVGRMNVWKAGEEWSSNRGKLLVLRFSFLVGEAGTDWDLVLFTAFSALLRPTRFSFFEFLLSFPSFSSSLLFLQLCFRLFPGQAFEIWPAFPLAQQRGRYPSTRTCMGRPPHMLDMSIKFFLFTVNMISTSPVAMPALLLINATSETAPNLQKKNKWSSEMYRGTPCRVTLTFLAPIYSI